jgi:hypothetical protein
LLAETAGMLAALMLSAAVLAVPAVILVLAVEARTF